VSGEFSQSTTESCDLISHKGIPQGSILSPILFNIYLREIASVLHPDTHILQYADDVVLYSSLSDVFTSRSSIAESLESLHSYLRFRGLDLAPHKSKVVIFSRSKNNPLTFQSISLQGVDIPRIDTARFLGVTLDEKLNGKAQLKSLIIKGTRVARIILSFPIGHLVGRSPISSLVDQSSEAPLNTVLKFLAWSAIGAFR